jgi:hypothetical protein
MGAILERANGRSASFHDADRVVAAGCAHLDSRLLTRELLTDLSIRGWIELCAHGPDGDELPIPRIRSEAQFIEPRNWAPDGPPTRYRLTAKGRARMARLTA